MNSQLTPALYVVATPLGNLEDITLRALRILKEVSVIACEDTRQTSKLLQHYRIDVPTLSYHEHNERERTVQLLRRLISREAIEPVRGPGKPASAEPGLVAVS